VTNLRANGAPADTANGRAIYAGLKVGSAVVIAFGSHGSQYARVVPRRGETKGVRIWRASSKSWTKPRRLYAGEIQRLATGADVAAFKPDFGAAWDRD
jgi:hypothetical protein